MQVTVETTSNLERKLTLQIPASEVDSEVEKKVADTAKKARLPGFRPGKVPRKVVKQRFGESLRYEVLNQVIDRSLSEAIQQESLKPVGTPSLDIVKNIEGENVELVATFEVFPTVELADVSTLEIERLNSEVSDADIEAMIEKLRLQRAEYEVVERAAQDKDQLNIDFAGKKDGEPFDGGTAEGQDLVLGSGQMIPGFEDGLVGAKAGETRSLDLTFPEEYHAAELAGQAVVFDITVNEVKEAKLPELDDEFFSVFEVEGSVDDFKAKVRENMETQLKDAIQKHLKQQVMSGLRKDNEVELPAALVGQEIQALKQNALQQFGGNIEQFDESLLPDDMFREQAEQRAALGVILDQFVKDEEIKPERDDLISFIDEIASSYDDPESVRNMYMSDEKYIQQINLMVVENMVVDRIVERANVTDKNATYDEVQEALQAVSQQ